MSTDTKLEPKHEEYSRENPFLARMLVNYKLNKTGSIKDTRHISIDLGDSGIKYIPGDSLYIYPKNDPKIVEKFLLLLELSNSHDDEIERFTSKINITRPSNKFYQMLIKKFEEQGKKPFKSTQELSEKYNGCIMEEVVEDLMRNFPRLKFTSNEIADNSSKLLPRAYSIASSQSMHTDTVDLCISRVDEQINGRRVLGVCSNYICDRAIINSYEVSIYVHENNRFRLPEDQSKDIIMVGPGTGIAPFRAFIEERIFLKENKGIDVGRNWLYFGDQKKAFDYLYGEEFTRYRDKYGLKVTTAFSRDQVEKVYVQTRMKENSAELYEWIKNGAYFYVCGDARRMAKDVDTTLREILTEHGEDADAYIKEMKDTGRYCRDVY